MSLFSVIVDIAARTASIEHGVKKSGELLEGFAEQAKKVGETLKGALEFAGIAASIGEAVHMFDEFTEHAEQMKLTAEQTGLAVEQFSRLEFAAKQTGVASEQLSAGLKIFARYATEAAGGSSTYVETFKAIGVSVKDASGNMRPMSDLLSEVADKFATYQDGTAKAALAQQLFGRAGAELIPLLDQGSKGIKEYGATFDKLGGTITKTTAEDAEKFRMKMNEVHALITGVGQTIMTDMLPALTDLMGSFTNAGVGARSFGDSLSPVTFILKEIIQWSYVAVHTFEDVGDALGGLSAVIAAAVTGHFSRAKEIWDDWQQHSQQAEQTGNEFLKKLWSDAGDSLDKLGDKADATSKKMNAPIVQLGGKKKAPKTTEDLLGAQLDSFSQSIDSKLASFNSSIAANNGRIIQANFDAWRKSRDATLQLMDQGSKQMTTFADQAARNIQSSFAKFLFDPFHGGMKGMLVSFIDTIRQMLAQAAASQILKALFGNTGAGGNGSSGLGGIFGNLLSGMGGGGSGASGTTGSMLGSIFSGISGAFAGGGYANSGSSYLVGERGPEIFTPGAGGYVTPNGQGAGMSYNPTFHIDARGADADRIMTVLPPVMQQMIAQSKYDLLQAFRRSGLPAPLRA